MNYQTYQGTQPQHINQHITLPHRYLPGVVAVSLSAVALGFASAGHGAGGREDAGAAGCGLRSPGSTAAGAAADAAPRLERAGDGRCPGFRAVGDGEGWLRLVKAWLGLE